MGFLRVQCYGLRTESVINYNIVYFRFGSKFYSIGCAAYFSSVHSFFGNMETKSAGASAFF